MRFFIRFAFILAGCAASPAPLFAQTPGGGISSLPDSGFFSTNAPGIQLAIK